MVLGDDPKLFRLRVGEVFSRRVTARGDILVAAAGKAEMIRGGMVKEGAVVIDVGVNRLPDGRLVGDVAFSEVEPKASYITPVPGGGGADDDCHAAQEYLRGGLSHGGYYAAMFAPLVGSPLPGIIAGVF